MSNNYNRLAPFYDVLVRLVFGQSVLNAQLSYIHRLKPNDKVLIVGGGSGRLLPSLLNTKPDIQLDYLEASHKMKSLAKEKVNESQLKHINFIPQKIENFPVDEKKYDAILCFFFIDLFPEKKGLEIILKLNKSLTKDGIWLVADFNQPKTVFQRMVDKLMFLFLKLTTKAESEKTIDYKKQLKSTRLAEVESTTFYGSYIFSAVFKSKE
ncbi:MAG: methyltransferase domain-containing protein [Vicingaceae bacterium]